MVPLAEIWRERPQAEQNMACALLAAPHRSQKRVDESAMHLFFCVWTVFYGYGLVVG